MMPDHLRTAFNAMVDEGRAESREIIVADAGRVRLWKINLPEGGEIYFREEQAGLRPVSHADWEARLN